MPDLKSHSSIPSAGNLRRRVSRRQLATAKLGPFRPSVAVPQPATLGTGALVVLLMTGGLRGKRMRHAFIP
jgi:hypothetical protein